MSEQAEEKCKYCGRKLNQDEIYEICGCLNSRQEAEKFLTTEKKLKEKVNKKI